MTNQNPATPVAPAAATPGNGEPVVTNPSGSTPAPVTPGQGGTPEAQITISAKEYRDLQRAKARTLSFDKRVALKNKTPGQAANTPDDIDAQVAQQLDEANQAREAAERRALQAEVRGKVADMLGKDEFKALPKSTRELILKNPAMLTQADNLEEALLDIEDFVRDQVLSLDTVVVPGGPTPPQTQQPASNETPPVVNGGGPAPASTAGLEDLSKLHGPARSQAAIRNLIKTKKGG